MKTQKGFGLCLLLVALTGFANETNKRPRIRELGVTVGVLPTGKWNAITDVHGVRVGHTTLIREQTVRTGVTAVLPHSGNVFREKVPAAIHVGNGFGKLAGSTQVKELGEIETPILLTSTLSVPKVADALLDYMLKLPGNEEVRSINPIVAETNDGYVLNDGRGRHISGADVLNAIQSATDGPVQEGSVGAGTGTIAFGFKGGIGTASRKLPASLGGYTVGVLTQTNYGGVLTIAGVPVGKELGRYYLKEELESAKQSDPGGGSIIIVIATDAPVDSRNLERMAARAMMGLARTGASGDNGSGDYAIAFSTAPELRIRPGTNDNKPVDRKLLSNDAVSPVLFAVIEATEEAIYNSLFRAETVKGHKGTIEALPLEQTVEILRKYGAIK